MSDFIEAPFRLFDVFKIALVQKPALHKLQSQQSPKQTLQTAFRLFNQEVTIHLQHERNIWGTGSYRK